MNPAGRTSLVAGNWKMHGTLAANTRLVEILRSRVREDAPARMIVCPPFPYVRSVVESVDDSPIEVGAQDVSSWAGPGAYTGEVAASMLADIGCRYVIVGHSERRALLGDTDELVAAKFEAGRAAGLTPILCVGETLAQRDAGETHGVVKRQVEAVLEMTGVAAFAHAVVAYEPVWAIGTGRTPSPEGVQEVHATIRTLIASQDDTIAANLAILYGGSVKAGNAAHLFGMPDIDGGLIGGASLNAEEFLDIFHAACQQVHNC